MLIELYHSIRRTLAHLENLHGSDYRAWGTWLVENFYAAGREPTWPSLLAKVPELNA